MLLITFSIIAFIFFNKRKISWQKISSPLFLLLLLQFAWIFIASLFSTNTLTSYKFLLAKSWYLFAFVIAPVILLNDRKKILTTALTFSIGMILYTIVAMSRHAWQGFTFGSINESVEPFFRNHVTYSALLVCVFPLVVLFLDIVSKNQKLVLLVVLIFLVCCR